MANYAPGFINITCHALGGEISISTAHIVAIAPTAAHRDGTADCILILDSAPPLTIDHPRSEVLQAISEAAGTDRAGTGAAINKIAAGLQANTQALQAAVQNNRIQ